ncbi:cation:proton antiporter [Trujillonella humicola]|uniref:cation:proton antiporter n=1 Tax=Trujillonella humicola TaxID=3383699 RepID=UPI00390589F8
MTAQAVLGGALLVTGVALVGLAAAGLVRLPDAYNRANAVAKAAGLGVVCVLLAVAVLVPDPVSVGTVVVAAALQLFTVPLAGFAIGEAAWRTRAPLHPTTRVDPVVPVEDGDRAGTPEQRTPEQQESEQRES